MGLTLIVAVVGCASGGSGGGSGSSVFRQDIGIVMVQPLLLAREKIFAKHQIPMLREQDTTRSINWETQWIPRNPVPEESAAGVVAARNRIFIKGTYVEERLDGTPVLRVRFEVENQVQTSMDPQWHAGPMPEAAKDLYQEVYDDLMLELRAGIIR